MTLHTDRHFETELQTLQQFLLRMEQHLLSTKVDEREALLQRSKDFSSASLVKFIAERETLCS